MREGEHPDPATEPAASSSWGAVPVVVVVAILVLLLYLTLLLGAGNLFDYFILSYEGPALGVAELGMVPIGVLAGAVLRSRCAWLTALRNGRWRGIALSSDEVPFMTAGMLIVVTMYLMASWGGGGIWQRGYRARCSPLRSRPLLPRSTRERWPFLPGRLLYRLCSG